MEARAEGCRMAGGRMRDCGRCSLLPRSLPHSLRDERFVSSAAGNVGSPQPSAVSRLYELARLSQSPVTISSRAASIQQLVHKEITGASSTQDNSEELSPLCGPRPCCICVTAHLLPLPASFPHPPTPGVDLKDVP